MKTKDKVRKSCDGADVALERLRCAEGAVQANCTARPDLSLRDIADPTPRGLRQPDLHGCEVSIDGTKRVCL